MPGSGTILSEAATLQCGAVPVRAFSASGVSALQKIQKRRARRLGPAHILVHQDELREILVPERRRRAHRLIGDSGRLRRSVGIIRRSRDRTATGPEPRADALVRVRFAGDDAFARRSGPPGKTRTCQVEAAPEKVN